MSSRRPGAPWARSRTAHPGVSDFGFRVLDLLTLRCACISALRRILPDHLYGGGHISNRSSGQNTVPQVEDMPRTLASLLQDAANPTPQFRQGRQQCRRVQVALNGRPVADPSPGFIQPDAPIHTQHCRACLFHGLQQRRLIRWQSESRGPRGPGLRGSTFSSRGVRTRDSRPH